MCPENKELFPVQESLDFGRPRAAITNTLFHSHTFEHSMPRSVAWKSLPLPENFTQNLSALINDPTPQILNFATDSTLESGVQLLSTGNSNTPVAFLATDNVYKNCYTLLDAMEESYTPRGIITDGRCWRLYHAHAFSPLEHFLEINLPVLIQSGGAGLQYFQIFFTAQGYQGKKSLADAAMDASRRSRDKLCRELARAAEAAVLDICRGFIRAERAATGAIPEGRGLLMVHRHALLITCRMIYLLYAEARGALPASAAHVRDVGLTRFMARAADPRTQYDPAAPLSFGLWPLLMELFDRAFRGDRDLGAAPQTCEFFDPDYHMFLQNNRADDFRLHSALRHLSELPQAFAPDGGGLHAMHVARALIELPAMQLCAAHEPMVRIKRGREIVWAPAAGVKWVKVLDRISEGGVFLKHADKPPYQPRHAPHATVLDFVRRALPAAESAVAYDPFCGPGRILLAAAERLARNAAQRDPDTRFALHKRRMVQTALRGADPNPFMAELTRLVLTLYALSPNEPPPVLEHRIVCGNTLLGVAPAQIAGAGEPGIQNYARGLYTELETLARDSLAVDTIPADTYGQARRRHNAARRILKRASELCAGPDLWPAHLAGNQAATKKLAGLSAAQDKPAGRLSETLQADPFDPTLPLHEQVFFPELFLEAQDRGPAPSIVSAPPRNFKLPARLRRYLCEDAPGSGHLVPTFEAARAAARTAAHGAPVALLVPNSFFKTKSAEKLMKFFKDECGCPDPGMPAHVWKIRGADLALLTASFKPRA